MKHAIHRVGSFEIASPYTLRVRFEDGTEQTIDFEPMLAGELYGPLRDLELFNQVRIDPDAHTLVWPNGADFDPANLHDCPNANVSFGNLRDIGRVCKPNHANSLLPVKRKVRVSSMLEATPRQVS